MRTKNGRAKAQRLRSSSSIDGVRKLMSHPTCVVVDMGGVGWGGGESLVVSPCSNTPLGENVVSDFTASSLLVVLVYCQFAVLLKAVQTEYL